MIYAGLFVLACCAVWLVGLIVRKIELHRRGWTVFAVLSILGMALVALSAAEPPESWDLSRHYALIESMKTGGIRYVMNESVYAHLPVTNALYAFVAFIGPPQLLPCLTSIICYGILAYIIADCGKRYSVDSRVIGCLIVFNLAFCPFLHMVSGIRNILAYSVAALGFYKDFAQHKRITGFVIYASSIFIHPSATLIVGLRFVYPFFKKWRWIGLALATWSLLATAFSQILIRVPVVFVSNIGYKLYEYTNSDTIQFTGYMILFVKFVFIVAMLVMLEYYRRHTDQPLSKVDNNLVLALEMIVLVAVGAFKTPFIADRMFYFIAFFAVPAFIMLYNRSQGRIRYILAAGSAGVGLLSFAHQWLYFINS